MVRGVLALSVVFIGCNDDRNLPPESQSVAFSVAEDVAIGTIIGTISASDPEEEALTFRFTAGNESDAFALSETGTLRTLSTLDFETISSYTLTVTISDEVNEVGVTISIQVTNVEEDAEDGSGNEGVEITIDDVTYTVVDGVIEDYGGDITHYNYGFTLIDDVVDVVSDELVPGEQTTIGIYTELFSAGPTFFFPGTFDYLDQDANAGTNQSYFISSRYLSLMSP